MVYYNRYNLLRYNNNNYMMPRVIIPLSSTDKETVYKKGITRFDKLSDDYFGNPYHGFLILAANPQFTEMEFDIEEGSIIRIPYPFENALTLYNNAIKEHILLEGLK